LRCAVNARNATLRLLELDDQIAHLHRADVPPFTAAADLERGQRCGQRRNNPLVAVDLEVEQRGGQRRNDPSVVAEHKVLQARVLPEERGQRLSRFEPH